MPETPTAENRPWGARRPSRVVPIGHLRIGGDHPILIQSMTVADTMDTDAVVAEIRELVEAGCPLVRLTAPSVRDAENLREIRRRLKADGALVPMVADIHFTPNAALLAAEIVEKVRINPGNYADRKRFSVREYTATEYREELERVAEGFRPLVRKLKEFGAALRIGTNHGSLSDRIMNRYGDTPEGMVESALEFVRICEDQGYRSIVLSMKSSIAQVMIAAYRLLVRRMDEEGMDYPLHLGVTEAGEGLEARIKSAVGIGSLLADGIGDTIRVSLTEKSRHEIAAAQAILAAVERETRDAEEKGGARARVRDELPVRTAPQRRRTDSWMIGTVGIGGDFPVRVESRVDLSASGPISASAGSAGVPAPREPDQGLAPEIISVVLPSDPAIGPAERLARLESLRAVLPAEAGLLLESSFEREGEIHFLEAALPLAGGLSLAFVPHLAEWIDEVTEERIRLLARLLRRHRKPVRWRLPPSWTSGSPARRISEICRDEGVRTVGFLCESGPAWIARNRGAAEGLADLADPIFLEVPACGADGPLLAGSVLVDGIGDALCLAPGGAAWPRGDGSWTEDPVRSAYACLQACRLRLTRAEFIACPSCGRTLFDLPATTARIRARTEHLKGIKIAIMGCIVNGPGEMADADFGYVGSGPGKVDLYVGKERVRQGVREAEACDRLLELIREHGRWADPPSA
jgi:(E)-4-hydroxy-3-methylbut-2-enyl-diphosphate synthase